MKKVDWGLQAAEGRGELGVATIGYSVSFGDDVDVLELDSGDQRTILYTCQKYQIVHFKSMNFMVCELYLNKAIIINKIKIIMMKFFK